MDSSIIILVLPSKIVAGRIKKRERQAAAAPAGRPFLETITRALSID
jgi:hypothetical protein